MTVNAARRPEPGARWPMTAEAYAAIEAEVASLMDELRRGSRTDAGHVLVRLADRTLPERIARLERILEQAAIVAEPDVAVIGRRVRVESDGDAILEVALVLPGDGDALRGWVSADAPLGAALLGARPGDEVTVVAPARPWTARLVAVA